MVDLWEALVIMARRWYVTLPLVVLTAVAVVLVGSRVEPTYSAGGTLLFVGPNQVDIGEDGEQVLEFTNPLLRFSGSIQTTARAIGLAVSSGRTASELDDRGLSGEYTVGVDNRVPIMSLDVTDDDPDVVLETLEGLVGVVQEELTTRQDALDAPPNQRVGFQVLSQPEQARASYGPRNRLRLVTLALGLALAGGAAFAVEGLARLRRRPVPGAGRAGRTSGRSSGAVSAEAREASGSDDDAGVRDRTDPPDTTVIDDEGETVLARPSH